ncbi:V-set and transmembrane domain-containing protein 1 isoform X1 [Crocuta crocuta]
MITEFLSLLCLGLSLGFEDEKKNETLTRPYLSALPSPVVERGGNVILRCQGHCQNVTFMLGKLQDSGYRQEQRSAGHAAEFFLNYLEPKDSGTYFCAYKAMDSQEWSEKSEHLQLEVTDDHDKRRGPPEEKAATGSTIAAICSCLSILILFLSIFFINKCTQDGPSHEEESTKRASHSQVPQQEATDSPDLERISVSAERLPESELC